MVPVTHDPCITSLLRATDHLPAGNGACRPVLSCAAP